MTQSEKFALLNAIAKAMKGEVKRTAEVGDNYTTWLIFSIPQGDIWIDYNTDRKGDRIGVSGSWPRESTDRNVVMPRDCYDLPKEEREAISISISATKPVFQIVTEIGRRFLPTFTRQYAACAKIVASRAEYAAAVDRNYVALAEAAGAKVQKAQHNDAHYVVGLPDNVTIKYVSDDSVQIDLRLSPEKACELLRKLHREDVQRKALSE